VVRFRILKLSGDISGLILLVVHAILALTVSYLVLQEVAIEIERLYTKSPSMSISVATKMILAK